MTARGYTTTQQVNDYNGGNLTAEQQALVDWLIPQAEEWIRRNGGVDWTPGVVTNEAYYDVASPDLFLKRAPVATLTTLTYRASRTDDETTMDADTDYELINTDLGWVRLSIPYPAPGWPISRILATYTPVATVPDGIALATTMLVSDWLGQTKDSSAGGLDPGIKKVSFGDLSIEAMPEPTAGARSDILRILGRRGAVMFA